MIQSVPFRILREDWGEYRLEDDLFVKARLQLGFVVRDPANPTRNQMRTLISVVTLAPDTIKGEPSPQPRDLSGLAPVFTYKNWTTERPQESVYMLEDSSLMVMRLVPTEFRRFGAFTTDGEPIVQVMSKTQLMVTPQPKASPQPAPPPKHSKLKRPGGRLGSH